VGQGWQTLTLHKTWAVPNHSAKRMTRRQKLRNMFLLKTFLHMQGISYNEAILLGTQQWRDWTRSSQVLAWA